MLHAGGDFIDVARHIADFDTQFARLRGNIADDPLRSARPAKAETRHERLLDDASNAAGHALVEHEHSLFSTRLRLAFGGLDTGYPAVATPQSL
ncbi:hypothetical protein [Paraburkholderia graminis]|uniref:Uncharacterized protein n=1 Tax=Paraburkholderia graminis TaxID=60548 RepID=A0ABD5CNS0_9BURK|nr:hypothetical protein [Paraburkholderia graminis]MDR6206867.1 hypothetical protein [Paraburkholderia graminis]